LWITFSLDFHQKRRRRDNPEPCRATLTITADRSPRTKELWCKPQPRGCITITKTRPRQNIDEWCRMQT